MNFIPAFNYHDLLSTDGKWLIAKIMAIACAIFTVIWIADNLFAPISVMKFGIVGFFGRRGFGKSFCMVTYARRWRLFNKRKPVFTNLEKFTMPGENPPCKCIFVPNGDIDSKTGQVLGDLWRLNGCRAVHLNASFEQMAACRDGLVAIDEAGIFVSNLNFAGKQDRRFARWLVGTRHYKVMVLLTAHNPGTINNRLRDVLDEFIQMRAYTKLKMFVGRVYESKEAYASGINNPRNNTHSHTVFIPMWRSTSNSYNTDSLRRKADAEGTNTVGYDIDIPGLGEAIAARNSALNNPTQTTTNGVDIYGPDFGTSGTMVGASVGAQGSYPLPHSRDNVSPDSVVGPTVDYLSAVDASILGVLISRTAGTWNRREIKPKSIRQRKPG
jgi:hypothetical protein